MMERIPQPRARIRPRRLLPCALALACVEAAPAASWTLTVEGEALGVRFADLDGDGDHDAVVTAVHEAESRLVREILVFPRGGAGYAPMPCCRHAVADAALFIDVADIGAGEQALLVDTQGVQVLPFHDGRLLSGERVAEAVSAFQPAQSRSLPFLEVVRDLDLDGRRDLLLPGRDGPAWFRGEPGTGFAAPVIVPMPPRHGVRWGRAAYVRKTTHVPRVHALDWEGDGDGDLLFSNGEALLRVELGRSGTPAAPRTVLDLAELLDPGKAGAGGLVFHEGSLRDVDGDGRCDLLVTQRTARPNLLSGIATRTLLFLHDDLAGSGDDPPRPRQMIRTDGATSPPRLADLDGDGHLDLILTTVPTDLLTRMREQVFEAANVTFFVYRFDPDDGRFSDEPVFSDVLPVPADRLLEVGAYGWVTFEADYDGDGRPDFATYDAQRRTFQARRGVEKRGFFSRTPLAYEDDPVATATLDLPGPFSGIDVDGDGKAEVVSHGVGRVVIAEVKP